MLTINSNTVIYYRCRGKHITNYLDKAHLYTSKLSTAKECKVWAFLIGGNMIGLTEDKICTFWSRVNKTDYCWEWTGTKNLAGYGSFSIKGETIGSHRISYFIRNGEIPKGLCILHKCDNPSCVNPDHLFMGTRKDNMDDKVRKGRQSKGEKSVGYRKLEKEQVLEIVELLREGFPVKAICPLYNISKSSVSFIKNGITWGWLTGINKTN